METGSIKKIIILLAGILVAYAIASTLSTAVVILFHLNGPAGMIAGILVYAAFFFATLHLLEKYAHIVVFGFDRE
jgi:uncharacterized membrane protein required for colicin V production